MGARTSVGEATHACAAVLKLEAPVAHFGQHVRGRGRGKGKGKGEGDEGGAETKNKRGRGMPGRREKIMTRAKREEKTNHANRRGTEEEDRGARVKGKRGKGNTKK